MLRKKLIVLFFLLGIFLVLRLGCLTSIVDRYDPKPLTIQTLNLFNQKVPSDHEHFSLSGNWLYRLERLSLIAKQLETKQADILFFQEVLKQQENIYNSDVEILRAYSLAGYKVEESPFREHPETGELETLSLVTKRAFSTEADFLNKRKLFQTQYPFLGIHRVDQEQGQPIHLFHVNMDSSQSQDYSSFFQILTDALNQFSECSNRIVVAGFFAGPSDHPAYLNFLEAFKLRDTALGFCENEKDCFTGSHQNSLYYSLHKNSPERRGDRILVSSEAQIPEASRLFLPPSEVRPHLRLSLKKIWPTARFGWQAKVRFPKCKKL